MLWDASFDQNHIIDGKRYSEHIGKLFGVEGGVEPTKNPSVGTTTAPTRRPTTETSTTAGEKTSLAPPTRPCKSNSDLLKYWAIELEMERGNKVIADTPIEMHHVSSATMVYFEILERRSDVHFGSYDVRKMLTLIPLWRMFAIHDFFFISN